MAHQLTDIRKTIPRHPTRKWGTRTKANAIYIHTTGSNNQDPNKTARYHVTPGKQNHLSKRGAPCIAYHDFITKTGTIFHCNDYTDRTWHTKGSNRYGVGVTMAFRGQTGEAPCELQYTALKEHLVVLCLYLKILPVNVKGHREADGFWKRLGRGGIKYKKTCPGMGVDLDALRADITRRLQRRLAAEGLYRGKIDGDFGRKSRAGLDAFQPSEERRPNWSAYRS